MLFRLEGRESFQDITPIIVFEIETSSVSEAFREAVYWFSAEKDTEILSAKRSGTHFTLFADRGKGEKIVLTVTGLGQTWPDAVCNAYKTVCGWQMQEPNLPEQFKKNNNTGVYPKTPV